MKLVLSVCLIVVLGLPLAAAEYHVNWDGSADFTAIQEAIDASVDGDTVIVHPGVYSETTISGSYYVVVEFWGKNIVLRSLDPNDPRIVESTVIDGLGMYLPVSFVGTEDSTCVLSGFTIRNGYSMSGGGISGTVDPLDVGISSARISNCIITGNVAWGNHSAFLFGGMGGGLLFCDGPITNCVIVANYANTEGGGMANCDGPITNCLIAGNRADGVYGGGLYDCDGAISNCTISGNYAGVAAGGLEHCSGIIVNSIIWGKYTDHAEYGQELEECVAPSYCCVRGWTGEGEGNISDDPRFAFGPLGDCYLSCRASGQTVDSPCIDVGSNSAEFLNLAHLTTRTDGFPDTGVVDIGYHYPSVPPPPPKVEIETDRAEYAAGDEMTVSMSYENRGVKVEGAIYFAFGPESLDWLVFWPWMTFVPTPYFEGTLWSGVSYPNLPSTTHTIPESLAPGGYLCLGAVLNADGSFASDIALYPVTIQAVGSKDSPQGHIEKERELREPSCHQGLIWPNA